MPWEVIRRGSRFCVVKIGSRMPIPGGCHPDRKSAIQQVRALYAQEAQRSAKEKPKQS